MLKRNPTAGSEKHYGALEELKHEYEEYKLNKKAEKLRKNIRACAKEIVEKEVIFT